MMSLENRFIRFMTAYPGAENIDDLLSHGSHISERRADFLLSNRRIIIELKTLKSDTSPKVEKEIVKHRKRDDFPLIYGNVYVQKVLKHLPDGEDINKRIFRNISRSVEDAVRSAETQIADTKTIFRLQDSIGVLVILNDTVDILSPDVVGYKASEVMMRKRNNSDLFSPIDFVWLLFESHLMPTTNLIQAFPSILIEGARGKSFPWFNNIFDELQGAWAQTNYGSLILSDLKSVENVAFLSSRDSETKNKSKLTRQQSWEQAYDSNPFLRSLSDQEVLDYGSKVIRELAPYFLKGGPQASHNVLTPLLQAQTCFLKEANFRGLDMRKLRS